MDELKKLELEKKIADTSVIHDFLEEYKKHLATQHADPVFPVTIGGTGYLPFPPKKRGRPKGSKSKTKVKVAVEVDTDNWIYTFHIPVKILMETPINVLENMRDEKDLPRKLRILATILEDDNK